MVKHILIWKPVKCTNAFGEKVLVPLPESISIHYRGTLLTKILSMPPKQPISFSDAIHLVAEKQIEALKAGRGGPEHGHLSWYTNNFVEWISELGYHIELTGDEFESRAMSAFVA